MSIDKLVPWLAVILATGCATSIALTSGGTRVEHVQAADVPPGCNLLGDVPIGIPPDAARPRTEEQLVILMRNKTHEMGGNRVIIDTSGLGARGLLVRPRRGLRVLGAGPRRAARAARRARGRGDRRRRGSSARGVIRGNSSSPPRKRHTRPAAWAA
jgi:hypothetical protein